jgi:methylthioribose-1-phosphate isomerase
LKEKKRLLLEPKEADFIKAFYWETSSLYILDQRRLPSKELYYRADTLRKVRYSIKEMLVRGAPAIGIVTAIGVYIGLKEAQAKLTFPTSLKALVKVFSSLEKSLSTARPTAVNLFWALKRMKEAFQRSLGGVSGEEITKKTFKEILESLQREALSIWEEDLRANLKMAEYGWDLLPEGGILTHCNTGALATGGYGTALGVIRRAFEKGKKIHIWVDETRPFLQGARLTAWELSKLRIPFKIITDNSAGYLMKKGEVRAIIVGADRIAGNGDTANKIGTYSLSVLAKEHGIPFYVAAPSSTFDLNLSSGEGIPVEVRSEREVLFCGGRPIAPEGAQALNLAFDVTPAENITAIITEQGVIYPPYRQNIQKLLRNG